MYEAYYGFSEKPFALSPDPKYLFLSQTHREVLGHLVYGIEEGEGFMAISGEVGTGKTTLCRTLLERLGTCEIAFLFNPTLTPTDLIKAINSELGLSTFGDSRAELIDVLNTYLIEQHAEGTRVLVIIDEAQNLPRDTLEQLRLLGNLESQTQKLLQILLIGQPELDRKLEARELRQLRQRISVWWRLESLAPEETRDYVRHRLRIASDSDRPYFTDAALRRMHRLTGGVPRLINVLADRSLLAGFGEERDEIPAELVQSVADELRPRPTRQQVRRRALTLGLTGAALAATLSLLLAWAVSLPTGPPTIASDGAAAAPTGAETALADDVLIELPPVAARARTDPSSEARARFTPARPDPPAPLEIDVTELDAMLGALSPDEARQRSLVALLGAWGHTPGLAADEVSESAVSAILRTYDLALITLSTIDEVLGLDQPAIVPLVNTAGAPRSTLLLRVEGDYAILAGLARDRLVRISLQSLRLRWVTPLWTVTAKAGDQASPRLHVPPNAQSSISTFPGTILASQ